MGALWQTESSKAAKLHGSSDPAPLPKNKPRPRYVRRLFGLIGLMALIALAQGASFQIEFSSRYIGSLLYLAIFGSVIAFAAYFSLLGRIGAGAAAYSTLLFPLVALSISTIYEGYQWHLNAVIGLCLILLGNLVMFAKPGSLTALWRRRAV